MTDLSFVTRNTIPWRLECELEGLDREFGLKQYGLVMEQFSSKGSPSGFGNDSLYMIELAAYIGISLFTLFAVIMGGAVTLGSKSM